MSTKLTHERRPNPALMKHSVPMAATRTRRMNKNKDKDKESKKHTECFNCHKMGHIKADCWAKGGGHERQWPKKNDQPKPGQSTTAPVGAVDDFGSWTTEIPEVYNDSLGMDMYKGDNEVLYAKKTTETISLHSNTKDIPMFFDYNLKSKLESSKTEPYAYPEAAEEHYDGLAPEPKMANTAIEVVNDYKYKESAYEVTSDKLTTGDCLKYKLYDSGASRHMSPYHHHFTSYHPITPHPIHTADKCQFFVIGRGNVKINVPNRDQMTHMTLKNTLYTPSISFTLISINHIANSSHSVLFEGNSCKIKSL